MMTLSRIANTNNVDAALQAGRTRQPVRPVIVIETWCVLIVRGGTFQDGAVVGGEPVELLTLTCESGKFGEALREAGYDLSMLDFEYIRERV